MSVNWVHRLPWDIIDEVAESQNVPAVLLATIVQTESGGNKYAIRFEPHYKYLYQTKANAMDNNITEATETVLQMCSIGLCQLMGAVARELGLKGTIFQLLEPEVNLTYCAMLMKKLARKYSQKDDLLAAYNAGSAIKQMDGKYKNQHYVDKANAFLAEIKTIQGR